MLQQRFIETDEEAEEEPFDMEGFLLDGAPEDYICPLSLCLMEDAVVAMDGICYSRCSIQEHIDFCELKGKSLTSPMTGETMGPRLVQCVVIRRMVLEYVQKKRWSWRKGREQEQVVEEEERRCKQSIRT